VDSGPENSLEHGSAPPPDGACVFYDGASSRRHQVQLALNDRLEISENGTTRAIWTFTDIRRADSAAGLRLSCLSAPSLARLEIRDAALAAALSARCPQLNDYAAGRHGVATIVGWSVAATVSIVAVIWFGLPFAADRLAPLVPNVLERRIGDAAEGQIKVLFGGKACNSNPAGRAAFVKLMKELSTAAGIDAPVRADVLDTPVPNAFALPGGKVYLFSGLLAKAENPDEIAGVLAHELGHVSHRDNTRNMIYSGGTSFLIGLLFGDVTGSGALVFASRSLVTASYTREAEQGADDFSIQVMHRLGRPTKAMGELIFRITGNQADKTVSFLANHPLTEDRLKHLSDEDRPASGPPLLTDSEWAALKAVCKPTS
jgi:Zn-dependent protease with chaperone function